MKPEDVTDKTLGWHKLAVDKLRKHPELLPVVKRNIENFREKVHPSSMHYVLEWGEH